MEEIIGATLAGLEALGITGETIGIGIAESVPVILDTLGEDGFASLQALMKG